MFSGTRRIVAIDYDAAIGQRLRTAFQAPDYDFHWFADGREALDRLHEIRPDVIVCDLMLPGLDGRAVLEAVRRSPVLRDVPFLVLSGVRSEATIRATLDAGAQAFLVKPCPVSQLKQTVHKVLEETTQPLEVDLGEAPRRHVEGLRLIPTGSPGGAAAYDPTDAGAFVAGPEAPIVCEGRISTLELDGMRFQVQTVAEGGQQEAAITTTVLSEGKEVRKAESRLACEDATTLKELLDGQHARALEAIRQLHAQGRLTAPLGERAPQQALESQLEPQKVGDSRVATPPPPTTGPASIDVPPQTPRPRGMPRKQAPSIPVAPDTVLLKPAQGNEPAPPEAEILLPRKQPAPARSALDTVLLEAAPRTTPSPPGGRILTDSPWPPPRRTFPWRYLPRALAAVLGLGVLAILLEGPRPDTVPSKPTAALSPKPLAPSEPFPSSAMDSTPIAEPSEIPRATEAPAAMPTAMPTTTPAAPASASPTAAERSPQPSAEPSPARQPVQERSDRMVRGRLQWAQALYDRGRYDEARTALNEVFKLAPSNAQARQLAAQLERSVAGMATSAGSDSAPEEDHRAVLTLLGRYETALEQGDVTSLRMVWPNVDPQEVHERRRSLRSWQLALRLVNLEVTGDEAVALCVSYDDMWTIEGERIENSSRVSFHLRRENGSWLIESVK